MNTFMYKVANEMTMAAISAVLSILDEHRKAALRVQDFEKAANYRTAMNCISELLQDAKEQPRFF